MHCPARLVGSRAQFDSATRFSSSGDLPSSAAFSRLRWQLGMLLSCARRLLSSWQGCNRAGPSSRDEAGVLQPLFHRTQERRWSSTNPGLRLLNRALHRLLFKMLTHRRMIKCIQPQDWFAAIDLKDAYFHVSILPRHRPFLRFASEGRAWQYRVLPFGLSLFSRVFTKIVEGALAPLREVGIRISTVSSMASARGNSCAITGTWCFGTSASWGFGSTGKRASSPLRRESLFLVWSRLGEYDGAPHGRARPISAELPEFLQRQDCGSAETAQRLLGHMASVAAVTPLGLLHMRPLQHWLHSRVPRWAWRRGAPLGERHTGVSPLLQPLDGPCLSTGRGALRTSVSACVVTTDASSTGWGATCNGQAASGLWTGPRLLWHINCLELLAVHLALRQFRPLLLGKHVLVRTDNTAAVSYINRMGGI